MQEQHDKLPTPATVWFWRAVIGGVVLVGGGWLLVNIVVPVIGAGVAVIDYMTPDLHDACEVMAEDSSYGVRIESYIRGNAPYRYLGSNDGGATWTAIYEGANDSAPYPANCEAVTFDGDIAYFVAAYDTLYITSDAGQTWHEAWTSIPGGACRSIRTATFADATSGTLELSCWQPPDALGAPGQRYIQHLTTTDGGLTWQDAGRADD